LLDLGAVRDPVAVRDLADLETAATEVSEVHDATLMGETRWAGPARQTLSLSPGRSRGFGIRSRRIWIDRDAAYQPRPRRFSFGNRSAASLLTRRPVITPSRIARTASGGISRTTAFAR